MFLKSLATVQNRGFEKTLTMKNVNDESLTLSNFKFAFDFHLITLVKPINITGTTKLPLFSVCHMHDDETCNFCAGKYFSKQIE